MMLATAMRSTPDGGWRFTCLVNRFHLILWGLESEPWVGEEGICLLSDKEAGFTLGSILVHKSDVIAPMEKMIVHLQSLSGRPIRVWKGDGDGSYRSKEIQAMILKHRIHATWSSPRDHEQNGDAEVLVRGVK